MHHAPTRPIVQRRGLERALWALVAAGSLGVALALIAGPAPWWPLLVFGAAPDLALFAGIAPGLERGQLHPRAVRLYNALHRPVGPIALALLAPFGPAWLGVAAAAWLLHIAVDRVAGYGLRGPDGHQRG